MQGLLKSNRYRYLRGKQFFPAVASAVFTAFASLILTRLIAKYAMQLPAESFSALYSNGYYNFLVLKVQNLQDLAHLSAEQVISSAFLGGFLAMILAVFIPMFICSSFKSGCIQSAYVRGNSKIKILLSYLISSLEIFAAVYVSFIVSLLVFSNILMGTAITSASLVNILAMFARELFAHFVFLTVCMATAFMVNKSSSCIIMLLFGVIGFPNLLTIIDLILKRGVKLSSLWIVNIIELWTSTPPEKFGFGLVVSLCTLLISVGMSLIIFVYSDIKQ